MSIRNAPSFSCAYVSLPVWFGGRRRALRILVLRIYIAMAKRVVSIS